MTVWCRMVISYIPSEALEAILLVLTPAFNRSIAVLFFLLDGDIRLYGSRQLDFSIDWTFHKVLMIMISLISLVFQSSR